MKFYNREKELKNLRDIELSSKISSKMTVIVGHRDYTAYSGWLLEKFFIEKLKLSNQYSNVRKVS